MKKTDKPALNLEELNLKYEGEKPAKYALSYMIRSKHEVPIWGEHGFGFDPQSHVKIYRSR
jgi:hypothetical protein